MTARCALIAGVHPFMWALVVLGAKVKTFERHSNLRHGCASQQSKHDYTVDSLTHICRVNHVHILETTIIDI